MRSRADRDDDDPRPERPNRVMRLHSTITSAYTRKVWVVAHELGLIDRLERFATNPHEDEYLRQDNPLCRIPTLVFPDGDALFDSPVICEYMDSLHSGPKLFPPPGPERWFALKMQALGDGILDANTGRRSELMRPLAQQSAALIEHRGRAVNASYAWLENNMADFASRPLSIGHIAVGCALGYSLFAYPDDAWGVRAPRLADWHGRFEERPSMIATSYKNLKASLSAGLIKEGPASKPLPGRGPAAPDL
jgi:glutathione S-transferase